MEGVKKYSIFEWREGEYALEQDAGRYGKPIIAVVYEQDLPALVRKGQALAHQAGCELVIERLALAAG